MPEDQSDKLRADLSERLFKVADAVCARFCLDTVDLIVTGQSGDSNRNSHTFIVHSTIGNRFAGNAAVIAVAEDIKNGGAGIEFRDANDDSQGEYAND